MKKSKFLFLILSLFIISGCKKDDSVLFKEEYESLNKESGYRSVSIDEKNPIEYITDEKLLEKIENKEDMVVYFGFNKCPWCRSIIETLLEVSKDLGVDKIYYLDVLDIRDVKIIDSEGKIKTEKEGSKSYQGIVQLLSDYLSDYKVSDQVVGKRIFAPNLLVIKNKEIKGVISGISDLQTDSKEELTSEMKKDSYDKIYELLSKYTSNSCSAKEGC